MATVKKGKKAQLGYSVGTYTTRDKSGYTTLDRFKNEKGEDRYYRSTSPDLTTAGKMNKFKALMNKPDSVISSTLSPREREVMKSQEPNMKKGGKVTKPKAKGGKQMIKRADGHYSQRGLWDNIRAAKGSGKKPTAAMLKQERKIKAKTKK